MTARLLPIWIRNRPVSRLDHVAAAGIVAVSALALLPTAAPFIGKVLAFGAAGWAIEFMYEGKPRYSAVFGGARIPWLPVYGLGGTIVLAVAPWIAAFPIVFRGAMYAGLLSALELGACRVDRWRGHCSWNYADGGACDGSDGCVDVEHAGGWGVLGLMVERLVG